MPILTTLIPAYKKAFLGDVFLGLRSQTLQDFRVVLSDDSPDGEIGRLIAEGRYAQQIGRLDITVVQGPRNARLNHQQLLDGWAGSSPLVHLHLDDDLIYPDFYRAHVAAHASGRFTLTASRRWLGGGDGRPSIELPIPEGIANRNERVVALSHAELCTSMLPGNANWIGELSNIVLSADAARRYPKPPVAGLNYYGLLDVGVVLEATRHGELGYLQDHLSLFRQHAGQTTHNTGSHGGRIMFLAWIAYALVAWQDGRLDARQAARAIETATRRIVEQFGDRDAAMNEYLALLEAHRGGLDVLLRSFGTWWRRLLASAPGTDPARYGITTAADIAIA